MESPLMNVKETAAYLHVGKTTVYKMIQEKTLKRVPGPGTIRFRREDVEHTALDKKHGIWKTAREQELERIIADKDAQIQNLKGLLYGLASGVMNGLRKEGLFETERR